MAYAISACNPAGAVHLPSHAVDVSEATFYRALKLLKSEGSLVPLQPSWYAVMKKGGIVGGVGGDVPLTI